MAKGNKENQLTEVKLRDQGFLFHFILGSEFLTELKHFFKTNRQGQEPYLCLLTRLKRLVRVKSGTLFAADLQLVCIIMTAFA